MLSRSFYLLLAAFVVVLAAAVSASAGPISYTETFQTAGTPVASSDGQAMTGYTGWTFYKRNKSYDGEADVAAGSETLKLDIQNGNFNALAAMVSAQTVAKQASFDVSQNPLTVSAQMGAIGQAGYTDVALRIGQMNFHSEVGYSTFEWIDATDNHGNLISGGYDDQFQTDQGFTTPNNGTMFSETVKVSQVGSNYQYVFSIDYGANHFSRTLTTSIASAAAALMPWGSSMTTSTVHQRTYTLPSATSVYRKSPNRARLYCSLQVCSA